MTRVRTGCWAAGHSATGHGRVSGPPKLLTMNCLSMTVMMTMMIMTMLAVIIIVLSRIINNVLTSSYHCNPPHKQTTVKDDSTTYNFNALYPHIPHIVCVNLMQKYTRIVILIHRMTSQDDWWSFSLQIEMFSIVTFKFPDWIVLICSRTYRWWSSCKVMRVVSYRLPWSPLPLASLPSLTFFQRKKYSWGHHIWSFCARFVFCVA